MNRQPVFTRSTFARFFVFRYSSTSPFVAFCETYRQLVVSRFDDSATTLQANSPLAPVRSPRSTTTTGAALPIPSSASGK